MLRECYVGDWSCGAGWEGDGAGALLEAVHYVGAWFGDDGAGRRLDGGGSGGLGGLGEGYGRWWFGTGDGDGDLGLEVGSDTCWARARSWWEGIVETLLEI